MEGLEKKWYVLRAIGGKEKKVKEYMRMKLHVSTSRNMYHRYSSRRKRSIRYVTEKKISKERNFYPGYVLVEAALVGEIPHLLRNITHVIGFLGQKGTDEPNPLRLSRSESYPW
jgi:transcriptional antiterminator NusG